MMVTDDDTVTSDYYLSGSDTVVDTYLNGRKVGATVNITTSFPGLPLSNAFGFRGSLPNTGPVDGIKVGNPATDAMVRLYMPAKVLQRESDGGVIPRLKGDVSFLAPSSMGMRVLDNTGSDVVVSDWSLIQSLAVAGTTFSGLGAKFTPPSTGFAIEVRRTDVVGDDRSRGPIQKAGDVFLFEGQSLITQLWAMASGGTAALPADAYAIMASTGPDAGIIYADPTVRHQTKVTAGSGMAAFIEAYRVDNPNVPVSIIQAGKGATTAAQRLPGSDNFIAMTEGIKHAGSNFLYMFISSGEYELLSDADTNAYTANIQAIVDGVEAILGRAVRVILVPLGAVWSASATRAESIRYQQWMLCQNFPARYTLGPPQADLQHKPADIYHLTNDELGYGIKARRMAKSASKLRGTSASDRQGPTIASATRTDATHIRVTINVPTGSTGMTMVNTAYASDFRGGLSFGTDSTFGTLIVPTAMVINAVSGSTQTVDFTFATVPVGAAVRGPYGNEPFNPSADAAIRTDMANRASMLCAVFPDGNIPIQPLFRTNGQNYAVTT